MGTLGEARTAGTVYSTCTMRDPAGLSISQGSPTSSARAAEVWSLAGGSQEQKCTLGTRGDGRGLKGVIRPLTSIYRALTVRKLGEGPGAALAERSLGGRGPCCV